MRAFSSLPADDALTPHHAAGEVSPQDRALVPQPQPGPSLEFIEQLKAFTISFRLPVTGAYKSF